MSPGYYKGFSGSPVDLSILPVFVWHLKGVLDNRHPIFKGILLPPRLIDILLLSHLNVKVISNFNFRTSAFRREGLHTDMFLKIWPKIIPL